MLDEITKRDLLSKLAMGQISRPEFIMSIPRNLRDDVDLATKLLRIAREQKDALGVQFGLAVGRSIANNLHYTLGSGLLCELLTDDWHFSHEDIAFFLGELKDPSTVDCLRKAAEMRLDYLDYDETYQFAQKCVYALRSIGNKEAVQALEEIALSGIYPIEDYATDALAHLRTNGSAT